MENKHTHPLYESPQKEANFEKNGNSSANQCICCGKLMKEEEVKMVHMNTDWVVVKNGITEEDCEKLTGAGSQGAFNIGNSCAKKMPKEFVS